MDDEKQTTTITVKFRVPYALSDEVRKRIENAPTVTLIIPPCKKCMDCGKTIDEDKTYYSFVDEWLCSDCMLIYVKSPQYLKDVKEHYKLMRER